MLRRLLSLFCVASVVTSLSAQTRAPRPAVPRPAVPYKTALSLADMQHKQAVIDTTRGTFVVELLPDAAPNHVGYFIKLAREGAYNHTTFHRAIAMGIIQGGDPLSTDPAKRALYGTGGLGMLAGELTAQPMTRGAVAAVLQPAKPDSAGSQFFVLVTDQAALQGQYTVFGRVADGLDVVEAISKAPVDAHGTVTERIEITKVTIRETPAPDPVPFTSESVEALAAYRAVLETSKGTITIALSPDLAPEHVRNFLRLAAAGVYDGTSFHRVVKGFVVQTGMVSTRTQPLTQKQQRYVGTLKPEFSATPHLAGVVSMARLDDPASASTSFFICTAPAPTLDGKYTVFGRVIDGIAVVHAIEDVPVTGDTPVERIDLLRVRLEH
jgi:peptidyl-prolyl cis-trans isomerase B (cyclophilin B)